MKVRNLTILLLVLSLALGAVASAKAERMPSFELNLDSSARPFGEALPDPFDAFAGTGFKAPDILEFANVVAGAAGFAGAVPAESGALGSQAAELLAARIAQARVNNINGAFVGFIQLFGFNGSQLEFQGQFTRTATLAALIAPDPMIAASLVFTNPTTEALTLRIIIDSDMSPLDPLTDQFVSSFEITALDTGGDPGASVDASLDVFLRDAATGNNVFVTGVSGTVTDTSPLSETFGPQAAFVDESDGMRIGPFLTISPGDTVSLRALFAYGDATTPLANLDFVGATLTELEAIPDTVLVPEPLSLTLMGTGLLILFSYGYFNRQSGVRAQQEG